MEEVKLKVKINGQDEEVSGQYAEAVQNISILTKKINDLDIAKKNLTADLKKAKSNVNSLFTESELRFDEVNTIDIMSVTGNAVAETLTITSKAAPKKDLISKKALISLLTDGIQDEWVTIKSQELLDYFKTQGFDAFLTMDELEENISAADLTTILAKTRELEKYKEEIKIQTSTKNTEE